MAGAGVRSEVNPEVISQAITQLDEIATGLEAQIKSVNTTKEEMLNDEMWHGPNKSSFMRSLAEYETAVDGLLVSARDHQAKLIEIYNAHIQAQQG